MFEFERSRVCKQVLDDSREAVMQAGAILPLVDTLTSGTPAAKANALVTLQNIAMEIKSMEHLPSSVQRRVVGTRISISRSTTLGFWSPEKKRVKPCGPHATLRPADVVLVRTGLPLKCTKFCASRSGPAGWVN